MRRKPWRAAAALVALTLVSHAVILLTPGFFSFDEWQKFDHVQAYGFRHFAQAYSELRVGPDFGYPVRPIGFLQQGVASLWMRSAPWASHLVGVLNHALVALAFVWFLRRAKVPSATAVLAGVLFVLSPLTTLATGWIAASFDQLYILFLLLAGAVIVRLPDDGWSISAAIGILLATVAALLSKETAVVAPGALLLVGYLAWAQNPPQFSWRPYLLAAALVAVPVTAYLLFRAPAIAASLAGHATESYIPQLSKIPSNAFRYFDYPFRLRTVEPSDGVFSSPWQPAGAALVHLLLVGAVVRLFGTAAALAYVAAYFLFLLPILALPQPFPQYLYGAGLAMSLAIAAVLARLLAERRTAAAMLLIAGVIGLCWHNLTIQRRIYEYGVCQTRFLDSVDALLSHDAGPTPMAIHVLPEPGASTRVAVKAVHARDPYTANGAPRVTFEHGADEVAAPPNPGATRVRLTAACTLRPE